MAISSSRENPNLIAASVLSILQPEHRICIDRFFVRSFPIWFNSGFPPQNGQPFSFISVPSQDLFISITSKWRFFGFWFRPGRLIAL
jgi:hypothetical protein